MSEHEVQVKKSHYSFKGYVRKNRWMSFHYQLEEILSREDIMSVLEVGPGVPILRKLLPVFRPRIVYKSIDIAEDLNPDVIGSVTNMPESDNSYDVVCAFQVLEHIPYEDFLKALPEMKRVSKKYVLISLPHNAPHVALHLKIPFVRQTRFAWKIPYKRSHTFDGQHYWEVGKRDTPVQKVRAAMAEHFTIKKEYVPFENQSHRFYVLEK